MRRRRRRLPNGARLVNLDFAFRGIRGEAETDHALGGDL